ncbi:hypothetical protein NQ318_005460 [Aromia moschata]|uniref:Uncharacterized protein n=1 Tax=Aromia moschata TaxID=1265417 RepID=A0AAV8YV50_9CUCU|nr:hypothetical protein NQ318_005460 [Aromia moschata]
MLLSGEKGSKGWETIGTDGEEPPLLLKDCISYDEIKLSVFLSVSSYTYFVNLGDRRNMAKYTADRENIQDEGVIVGMIGPRLKKPNVMEYQEIVINDKQNTSKNGYCSLVTNSVHKLFSNFYEETCMDFAETMKFKATLPRTNSRYTDLKGKNTIFDNHLYYKRLAISIDTLLMEANYRAKLRDTTAYVHVVGLGLGVWRISTHQEKVYMDAFAKRISKCGECKDGQIFPIEDHPSTGIKIHIFQRQPHEKLTNENADKNSVYKISEEFLFSNC